MKSDTGSRRDFARVVRDDAYGVRGFPVGYFSHVIDIGANMGAFSMLARCLNPHARIVAFEPAPETFAMLRENTELFDVETVQMALGDGHPVAWAHRAPDMSVRNVFMPGAAGTETMPSLTLTQMAQRAGVDAASTFFLKLDCEGAERSILELGEREVLRAAACFAVELHYQRTDSAELVARDPTQAFRLPYERYAKFLTDTLGETHVAVRPLEARPIGVSEHLFIHRKHRWAFGAPARAVAAVNVDPGWVEELTAWRARHLSAAAQRYASSRPLYLWGENSLSARVMALLVNSGRRPAGLIDRKGGNAITSDQFRTIVGSAGTELARPFVLVCSRSAATAIRTELENMGLRAESDFATLPQDFSQ